MPEGGRAYGGGWCLGWPTPPHMRRGGGGQRARPGRRAMRIAAVGRIFMRENEHGRIGKVF